MAVATRTAIPTRAWFIWAWSEDSESRTSHIIAERPYEGDRDGVDGGMAGYPEGLNYPHTACGRSAEGLGVAFQLTDEDYCRRCLAWADRHFH